MALRATEERWSRLLERYEASGQSLREFAASVDVSPKTLAWWRRQLERPASGFIEVGLSPTPTVSPAPSAPEPAAPTSKAPPLAVELVSRGLRIEVPAGSDLAWLRRVVEALC